mmetsp:Transcript_29995/g.45481  ORF Transcript_29995/g.45481 Transcript_29995/m.45481 type:complete len:367 (+) Transcript_29995:99-1199(+)
MCDLSAINLDRDFCLYTMQSLKLLWEWLNTASTASFEIGGLFLSLWGLSYLNSIFQENTITSMSNEDSGNGKETASMHSERNWTSKNETLHIKRCTSACDNTPDLEPSSPASKFSTNTASSSSEDDIRISEKDHSLKLHRVSPQQSSSIPRDFSSTQDSSISESSSFPSDDPRMLFSTKSECDRSIDCNVPFLNSISECFENCSQELSRRAKTSEHSERIGIADTLADIANILFDDDDYNAAYKVSRRAQIIYEMVVKESMKDIASALLKHAEYHERQIGSADLSEVYRSIATGLRQQPTPSNLSKAFQVHSQHRIRSPRIPRLRLLNRLLDRRLKRCREEVNSLTKALRIQGKSKDLYFKSYNNA